jgi:hypothetical protein
MMLGLALDPVQPYTEIVAATISSNIDLKYFTRETSVNEPARDIFIVPLSVPFLRPSS